ncbi:MAG TPA: ABC transporter permease [Burkholderiaceae bacterium]
MNDNRFVAFVLRVAALCRKELLAILKDPANRVILIAPAIVQSLLFGYAATYDLSDVPYAVLDRSRSPTSAELLARLDATGVFHRVATLETEAQMRDAIDTQQALLAIRIDPRLEAQLHAGATSPLQLIVDARNSNTAGSAVAYVSAVVDAYNRALRERHGLQAATPIEIETRAWYNPNLETRWNLMPGMIATLSMLQTLLLTALSVAREREQGTFDQLLVTPLSPLEIMIGKALPPIAVGLTQATLILIVTRGWFGVPLAGSPGSFVTLYIGLTAFTVASVGVGLSISALSANMQQAMLYTFVLMMPLVLLSGLTTPIANMPEALQTATLANPLRYAIDLVRRVYLEGVGLATVVPDLIPLAIIAAVTLPTAAWLFRHRLA